MLSACSPFVFLEEEFQFLEDSFRILNMTDALHSRPTVVQLTSAPAFKGDGPDSFSCSNCGHLLAHRVHIRALIAIDIECFGCKEKSRTPEWPIGESLPQGLITLGTTGKYGISEVALTDRSAISCDAEIQRVDASVGFKSNNSAEYAVLSSELLDSWEVELNILTNNKFAQRVTSAKKARARGNLKFVQCPPAWAIVQLQSRFKETFPTISLEDRIAVGFLAHTYESVKRWVHHHHFDIIAASICDDFNHTSTMLVALGYLSSKGNSVGITDTPTVSGRSPDLYINTGPLSRLSIEVKAPSKFFWPAAMPSMSSMETHIERLLKSARDQLSGEDGGVVVIGASHPDFSMEMVFKQAIINVIQRGNISSRIAAVTGIFHVLAEDQSLSGFGARAHSRIWYETNPHFNGTNPVYTED